MSKPNEGGDSPLKTGGTTHTRIFGNKNNLLNQSHENSNIEGVEEEILPCSTRSNFPRADTHNRIFGSSCLQSEDDASKWRRPPTPIPSKRPSSAGDAASIQLTEDGDEDEEEEEPSSRNDDDVDTEKAKEASKTQALKDDLRKRKLTPGKLRNNPKEGTHNRIFGSLATHDKAPWISSPSVDPKRNKPLQAAGGFSPQKGKLPFKSDDTHARIFGKVVPKSRDTTLTPQLYPKVEQEHDQSTQSRVFGIKARPASEPTNHKAEDNLLRDLKRLDIAAQQSNGGVGGNN